MAQDVHALAAGLGFQRVQVVGHDIGLMVAYAYAESHRSGKWRPRYRAP
jgi:pimeloyl-ACP methyl ester carboxylesterase